MFQTHFRCFLLSEKVDEFEPELQYILELTFHITRCTLHIIAVKIHILLVLNKLHAERRQNSPTVQAVQGTGAAWGWGLVKMRGLCYVCVCVCVCVRHTYTIIFLFLNF